LTDLLESFNRSEATYFEGRHSAIPGAGIFTFSDVIVCRRPGAGVDFNKIMGLREETRHRLPAMARVFEEIHADYTIEFAPGTFSAEALAEFAATGHVPDGEIMVSSAPVERLSLLPAAPSLTVKGVASGDEFKVFLDVYQAGLGVPAHLRGHPAFAHWWTLPGWQLFLAHEGKRAIGAAILFVHEGIAYLATAATPPEFRNRGAQTALLRTRIEFAKELGCSVIWTLTAPDSSSLRNMQRAGLEVVGRKRRLTRRLSSDGL